MSYDVHITRAETWFDSRNRPISRDDWLAYVATDPELRVEDSSSFPNQVLTKWWPPGAKKPRAWMLWLVVSVKVKYPDRATLYKMIAIAKKLRAIVQGDDLEVYFGGETIFEDLIKKNVPVKVRR